MTNIFAHYQLNDATWFVLSLLLILAVFFRFNRLWSLRNLDLLMLLAISPGVLFLTDEYRDGDSNAGYVWLFVCSGVLLLRLFLDSRFKRRPLLEQNLNASGLGLLCVAAFAFQVTRVVTEPIPESTLATCLLYTSDAADDRLCVDLGGGRVTQKTNTNIKQQHSLSQQKYKHTNTTHQITIPYT
mgnify:CR=1 FL=1